MKLVFQLDVVYARHPFSASGFVNADSGSVYYSRAGTLERASRSPAM